MAKPAEKTFTADELEQIFHAALAAGDVRGVESALVVMAPLDPRRAQRLLDNTKTALRIAMTVDGTPCCDMHNQHCEPPGDLCCWKCTEASHDTFPVRHVDGTPCVLATGSKGASGV